MVVTRRTPVVPAIPASRSNSSQPTPRAAKGKAVASQSTDSRAVNGDESSSSRHTDGSVSKGQEPVGSVSKSPKSKGKSKGKKEKAGKKKHPATSFIDSITRLFLVLLTLYSLAVCPTDNHLENPVCKGLSEYRHRILEPYILPPIQNYVIPALETNVVEPFKDALNHPSIAPHIARAKPYYIKAVQVTTPIVLGTKRGWETRVVPQWNKRVVPQWQKRVVPQWNRHVVPHIDAAQQRVEKVIQPYVILVQNAYVAKLSPRLHALTQTLITVQQKTQPYVILAASKTHEGYITAKPYAIPVLQRIQLWLKDLGALIVEARRRYVDPHVQRIWEKVTELSSSGNVKSSKTDSAPSVDSPVISVFSSVSSSGKTAAHSIVASDAKETVASAVGATPSSNLAAALSSQEHAEVIPSPTDAPAVAAASVIEESLAGALPSGEDAISLEVDPEITPSSTGSSSIPIETESASASSLDADVVQSTSSAAVVEETPSDSTPPPSSSSIATTKTVSSSAVSTPSAVSSTKQSDDDEESIDLDAFYADLGLDDTDTDKAANANDAETVPAVPVRHEESEEEKAERLRLRAIETAKKRADITSRHSKWERDLEELIKTKRKELRKNLVTLRKGAVTELKNNVDIRTQIEELVTETEKFLRGAEVYLKNMKKEKKTDEEKTGLWERIVKKIEEKFELKMNEVEGTVNSWYMETLNQEVAEVQSLAAEVKHFAEQAQTDLSLDYAWLDDVTYNDWQRYHDLLRESDKFRDQAFSIQNGSHPSPPVNPLFHALEDLQSEVQDVVVGFQTRLRRIKRNGERAFGGADDASETADDSAPSPEVSILPIVPSEDASDLEPEAEPVVIGRSEKEILESLGRAAARGVGSDTILSDENPKKSVPESTDEDHTAIPGSVAYEHMEL